MGYSFIGKTKEKKTKTKNNKIRIVQNNVIGQLDGCALEQGGTKFEWKISIFNHFLFENQTFRTKIRIYLKDKTTKTKKLQNDLENDENEKKKKYLHILNILNE